MEVRRQLLVLFFYHEHPRARTWVIRLGGKYISTEPSYWPTNAITELNCPLMFHNRDSMKLKNIQTIQDDVLAYLFNCYTSFLISYFSSLENVSIFSYVLINCNCALVNSFKKMLFCNFSICSPCYILFLFTLCICVFKHAWVCAHTYTDVPHGTCRGQRTTWRN